MAWTLRLSARAEKDIQEILAWTAEAFAEEQASIYALALSLALVALLRNPQTQGVKECQYLGPDIAPLHVTRQGRKGRHVVFLRLSAPEGIDVLCILHESMDVCKYAS